MTDSSEGASLTLTVMIMRLTADVQAASNTSSTKPGGRDATYMGRSTDNIDRLLQHASLAQSTIHLIVPDLT